MPHHSFNSNPDPHKKAIRVPQPGADFVQKMPQRPQFEHFQQDSAPSKQALSSATNRLINNAHNIFTLVTQVRDTFKPDKVEALHATAREEIEAFQSQLRYQQVDAEIIDQVSQILCAFVDESILNTSWGIESIWVEQGMLAYFRYKAHTGRYFFNTLESLIKTPNSNTELLEFMFICLSLGFQGQYRQDSNRQAHLEQWRKNAYEILRRQREATPHDLSAHWQPHHRAKKKLQLSRDIPLWVFGAISGLLLLGIFTGFSLMLQNETDQSIELLQTLMNNPSTHFSTVKVN